MDTCSGILVQAHCRQQLIFKDCLICATSGIGFVVIISSGQVSFPTDDSTLKVPAFILQDFFEGGSIHFDLEPMRR